MSGLFGGSAEYLWNPDAAGRQFLQPKLQGVFGGGDANTSTTASDTFARLTRDQWQSYVTNYVPYENDLIKYATSTTAVGDAMKSASADVNSVFDNSTAATQRRLAGLGLTLSPDEQAASTRSIGLARSLADVNAQNTARDATVARQQSILGNPTPRIGGLSGVS